MLLAYAYLVTAALIYLWRYFHEHDLDLFHYLSFADIAILAIAAWFGPLITVPIACVVCIIFLFLVSLLLDVTRQEHTNFNLPMRFPALGYFRLQASPQLPDTGTSASTRYLMRVKSQLTNAFLTFCNFWVLALHALLVAIFVVVSIGYIVVWLIRFALNQFFVLMGNSFLSSNGDLSR